MKSGDVLLIAGKGHETGQIIGDRMLPFSDHEAVAAALAGRSGMTAFWTLDDMAAAMRATKSGALPADAYGISIDSRTAAKGEAFFAIEGDNRDGHDFVDAALKAGAALAVVARNRKVQFAADAPLLVVDDVLEALRDLARAARARIARPKSSPSPARSARPAPRRRSGSHCRPTAKPMPRPPPTTITGACRCRWRAARQPSNTPCSKSA